MKIRVILAAATVFAGMLATVALLSATGWMDSLPGPAMGAVISAVLFTLLGAAMWLFNRKPLNLMGFKSPEEHLRELETAGLVEKFDFVATRAFEVEETEDEGSTTFWPSKAAAFSTSPARPFTTSLKSRTTQSGTSHGGFPVPTSRLSGTRSTGTFSTFSAEDG